MLPQTTRAKIRDALVRYLLKHIPSRYAQTYWDINKGTADDMNAIFDAIREDLVERGELGSSTQHALETFENNLKSRIADAAKKELEGAGKQE
jgi:hypothetical protein